MEPSHRTSAPHRPSTQRANTWPLLGPDPQIKLSEKQSAPVRALEKVDSFEEQLNQNPEDHFLSPPARMYEYDDDYDSWSSESDDDDDEEDAGEVEWGAGITDFALFDSDRRRASEAGQAIPQKWNDLLANQASALGRSVERTRAESSDDAERDDTAPGLTPDVSPHLADDLDVKSYHGQSASRPKVPSYLKQGQDFVTIVVRPPDSESAIADDDNADDDMILAFFPKPEHRRARPKVAPQRPGLSRGSRTLSGKLHVWRRPSLDSYSVLEDPRGEQFAESDACASAQ